MNDKRFTIPVVIRTEIVVDASDLETAVAEAERIAELAEPADGFVDGWNDIQRATPGLPTVESFGEFRVARVDRAAVVEAEVPGEED